MTRELLQGSRARGKKPLKSTTKAPNPILHEIRGFTYTFIQKAVFRLSKTRFSIFRVRWADFCPLGVFLRVFLRRELTIKARDFPRDIQYGAAW
jgi:hypothetical protein